MKVNNIMYLMCCILFVVLGNSCKSPEYAQKKGSVQIVEQIGTPIQKAVFDSLIKKSTTLLEGDKTKITINEYIEIIRLRNSIGWNYMEGEQYKLFYDLCNLNLNFLIKAVNAEITKGMCYHSKQYDIYIGGKPHQNSQYYILKE